MFSNAIQFFNAGNYIVGGRKCVQFGWSPDLKADNGIVVELVSSQHFFAASPNAVGRSLEEGACLDVLEHVQDAPKDSCACVGLVRITCPDYYIQRGVRLRANFKAQRLPGVDLAHRCRTRCVRWEQREDSLLEHDEVM